MTTPNTNQPVASPSKAALRAAVKLMRQEIHRLAFDANAYSRFGQHHGKLAWRRREKLLKRVEELERAAGPRKPADEPKE